MWKRRLGGCPGWSESSLGAKVILLVLSWAGSFSGQWMLEFSFPLIIRSWRRDLSLRVHERRIEPAIPGLQGQFAYNFVTATSFHFLIFVSINWVIQDTCIERPIHNLVVNWDVKRAVPWTLLSTYWYLFVSSIARLTRRLEFFLCLFVC